MDEQDPFLYNFLLDPGDSEQNEDIVVEINNMVQKAAENGLPEENTTVVRDIVPEHTEIFRTSFYSGLSAEIPPLIIEVV